MRNNGKVELDNLSNVGARLREFEGEYVHYYVHNNDGTAVDRRIVTDFAPTSPSQIPDDATNELEAQGTDPAAQKDEPTLLTILTMRRTTVESDPHMAVAAAVKVGKKAKATKKANTAKKPSLSDPGCWCRELVLLTPAVRLRRDMTSTIRTALTNAPNERKLAALVDALEEEMYAWGEREPRTIILTPHLSALTFVGLPEEESAA
jgi:hypothetical protein